MKETVFTRTTSGGIRMTKDVKGVAHAYFHRKGNVKFRNESRDLLMEIQKEQERLKSLRISAKTIEQEIAEANENLQRLIKEASVDIIGNGIQFSKPDSQSYNEAFTVQAHGEAKAFVYIETAEVHRANAAAYCKDKGITNDWLVANGYYTTTPPKADIHEANKSDMEALYQASAEALAKQGVLVEKQ